MNLGFENCSDGFHFLIELGHKNHAMDRSYIFSNSKLTLKSNVNSPLLQLNIMPMAAEHMFVNNDESTEMNLPEVSGCITCHRYMKGERKKLF